MTGIMIESLEQIPPESWKILNQRVHYAIIEFSGDRKIAIVRRYMYAHLNSFNARRYENFIYKVSDEATMQTNNFQLFMSRCNRGWWMGKDETNSCLFNLAHPQLKML